MDEQVKVGFKVGPDYSIHKQSSKIKGLDYYYMMIETRLADGLPSHVNPFFYWPKGFSPQVGGFVQRIIIFDAQGKFIKYVNELEKNTWSTQIEHTEFIETIPNETPIVYNIYNYNIIYNLLVSSTEETWVSGFLFGSHTKFS